MLVEIVQYLSKIYISKTSTLNDETGEKLVFLTIEYLSLTFWLVQLYLPAGSKEEKTMLMLYKEY